jgi:hypothetical protein
MREMITLEVPELLLQSARAVAARTQRRVETVLADWLELTTGELPIEQLSDEQVLALRDLQFSAEQQAELSKLLGKQRENELSVADRERLDILLDLYQRGSVQKARALAIAVDRGLQPPLSQS